MTAPAPSTTRRTRVRAPALTGRRWLGTGGADLSLTGLRGKIVLLDFWTSCCVNCQHVLEELRDLEAEFADVLVVVGVHSPKFAFEGTPEAVDAAVRRWEVHHPVLDDPDLTTWQAYAARAWPTLVVVDPTGYVVASMSGEGHAHGLAVLLRELVAEHEAAGTLHRGSGPYVPPADEPSALAFPSAIVALPARLGGGFLVSDTGHHQLVVLDDDLLTERFRIGTGERGLVDGSADTARFCDPAGLAVLPDDVAERLGWHVAVADAVNHAVRGLRFSGGSSGGSSTGTSPSGASVITLAGTGEQLRRREGGGPALGQDLSTPQAVAWYDDQLVIAMAGTHQLWALDPGPGVRPSPHDGVVRVIAGTSAEGVLDGPGELAWFAQTSALVPTADGRGLWVVDAESSALRLLTHASGADPSNPAAAAAPAGTDAVVGPEAAGAPFLPAAPFVPVVDDPRMANAAPVDAAGRPSGYEVTTVVGTGLFAFGFRDGEAGQALMQHPLGAAVLPDGSVAIADTYNGAVRRYDPATGEVSTLADDLAEPAALVVEAGGSTLVVVESAASTLVRLTVPVAAQQVRGPDQQVRRPPTPLAPGAVTLTIAFTPPTGQKLDDRWGDPTRLVVSASPPELLSSGDGDAPGLVRHLVLASPGDGRDASRAGVLHVSVQAAACDGDPATGAVPEFAACHLYQQDWGIPVVLDAEGPRELTLDLRGT